jgi:2-C-methyl-D-erythritol 4-phosphate cytidylyltransferase
VSLVVGGGTRQESSKIGLKGFVERPEVVLIHDAVRPFVTRSILLANLDAAIASGASNTCIPTADTLVHVPGKSWIESIPNREKFLRGQTPQTFRYDLIAAAHDRIEGAEAVPVTDDCSLVLEMGGQVAVVQGSEQNLKITSPFDFKVAEALLAAGETT